MGTVTQVLKYIVTADTQQGVTGFKNLSTEAEGSVGKLEGLLQKSPMAQSAMGKLGISAEDAAGGVRALAEKLGPAAIGAVLTKGISDFQNLAGEVLKFQRVAGTSAEESSRLVEVLGDYGVSADQGATSIGKFAKVIGTTPQVLEKYGVQIQKNKDGTVDLNGTLMKAADVFSSTTDETKRAALGAALFGKSWADLAPVLEQGSKGIKDAMDSVSQGKVLDQQDLKDAEDFRLAIDSLRDVVESLSVTVGKELVPQLKDMVSTLGTVAGAVDNSFTRPLINAAKYINPAAPITIGVKKFKENVDGLVESLHDHEASQALATAATDALAGVQKEATKATEDALSVQRQETKAKVEHAEVTKVLAEQVEREKKVQENAKRATEELTKALDDQKKKNDDLYQSFLDAWSGEKIDLPKAIDDVKTALLNYYDADVEAQKATKEHGAISEEAQRAQLAFNQAGRDGYDAIKNYAQVALETEAKRRGIAVDALDASEKVAIQKDALNKLKLEVPEYTGAIDEVSKSMDGVANSMDTAAGKTEDASKRIATALDELADRVASATNRINLSIGGVQSGLSLLVTTADNAERVIEGAKTYEKRNGAGWRGGAA